MPPPFRDPYVDPARWAPHGDWTPEGDRGATDRMPEFARDFFARLRDEFPSLRDGVVFLRWSVQPADVYAFFDRSPGFVVQIDPHLEYIIVFGAAGGRRARRLGRQRPDPGRPRPRSLAPGTRHVIGPGNRVGVTVEPDGSQRAGYGTGAVTHSKRRPVPRTRPAACRTCRPHGRERTGGSR